MKLTTILLLVVMHIGRMEAAHAQEPAKVFRVGVLAVGVPAERRPVKGFLAGLKDAGYIEGKNLLLYLPVTKNYDELRTVAEVYKNNGVDIIASTGANDTKIAAQITNDIPIVFLSASDPERWGLVKSLANPGTNITGFTFMTSDIVGKQLEVFKELVPNLRRATILYNSLEDKTIVTQSVSVAQKVSARLRLNLSEEPVTTIAGAERLVSTLSSNTTDGVFIICSSLFNDLKRISWIIRQKKLPLSACSSRHIVEAEALVSYGPDLFRQGFRAASYVDRILKGERPSDLPVQRPIHFELIINLKTAKEIGVQIPAEVLMRADKVIE